jgi:SGNH hydrolase-like domain, acetyltransferase AlgX
MNKPSNSSPGERPRTALDLVAIAVICAGGLFALGVLGLSVAHHDRWHSLPEMVRAYGPPAVVAIALFASLAFPALWRINIAMVMIPATLALFAADLVFAEKDRHDVHRIGRREIIRFASEGPVAALRSRGIPAYSFIGPQQLAYWRIVLHLDTTNLYPLAAISRIETYLCREAGRDVLYHSDEYGFNNPPGIWQHLIDVALIGDSFVHGVCVPTRDQIANIIRAKIPGTVNLGILGSGPLAEYGVVREYLPSHRPKRVAWFFYEGNDVDTVAQQPAMARRYLDSTFTQHLVDRQGEIDSLLSRYSDLISSTRVERTPLKATLGSVVMLRHLRTALGIALPPSPPKSVDDYLGLELSLAGAKRTVSGWGGTIYLVYLPDSHRFDPRRMTQGPQHNDRIVHSRTIEIAQRLGIPIIDMLPVFAADPDPKRFWYRPMSHYTPAGTQLVARTVLARLTADASIGQ